MRSFVVILSLLWLQTQSSLFNALAASPMRRIYSVLELLLLDCILPRYVNSPTGSSPLLSRALSFSSSRKFSCLLRRVHASYHQQEDARLRVQSVQMPINEDRDLDLWPSTPNKHTSRLHCVEIQVTGFGSLVLVSSRWQIVVHRKASRCYGQRSRRRSREFDGRIRTNSARYMAEIVLAAWQIPTDWLGH